MHEKKVYSYQVLTASSILPHNYCPMHVIVIVIVKLDTTQITGRLHND